MTGHNALTLSALALALELIEKQERDEREQGRDEREQERDDCLRFGPRKHLSVVLQM